MPEFEIKISNYIWGFFLLIALFACRKNSDVTTVDETPIEVAEHFEFTINGNDFYIADLSAWMEDHDTVQVTQLVNFGTGELPQFIFNIHGTSTGQFQLADMTLTLNEGLYEPHFFKCLGCAFETEITYFGEMGDYVIGTFSGQVPSDGIWYDINGKFAAIREN